jgi:hypothetical protein
MHQCGTALGYVWGAGFLDFPLFNNFTIGFVELDNV